MVQPCFRVPIYTASREGVKRKSERGDPETWTPPPDAMAGIPVAQGSRNRPGQLP
jgi:hypothetical protein